MLISRRALGLSVLAASLGGAVSGCSLLRGDEQDATPSDDNALTVLVDPAGSAQSTAVQEAVEAFTKDSGIQVTLQVTRDPRGEMAAGLASQGGADVVHLTPDLLAAYAQAGSLNAYTESVEGATDLHPALVANATYEGAVYGVPTDFSTLALYINSSMWQAAGLTEADYPTTWEALRAVSSALSGEQDGAQVSGLALSPQYARLGAFMVQAGGGLTDAQGAITAASEGSVAGLNEVKELLGSGATLATDLDANSGAEAFSMGQAAMTIEPTEFAATLAADHPDLAHIVVELPQGPVGKGTLLFARYYAVAESSPRKKEAISLISYLSAAERQLALASAAGTIPASQSATLTWTGEHPELKAFATGAEYAVGMPVLAGSSDAIASLDDQLTGLAEADPQAILSATQVDLEAASA